MECRFILVVIMYVFVSCGCSSQRSQKRVMNQLKGSWEQYLDPLQEQYVIFTTETSLQPLKG